jgi:hypothetical protein
MKKISILIALLVLLFSCKKEDNLRTSCNPQLLGNWNLYKQSRYFHETGITTNESISNLSWNFNGTERCQNNTGIIECKEYTCNQNLIFIDEDTFNIVAISDTNLILSTNLESISATKTEYFRK